MNACQRERSGAAGSATIRQQGAQIAVNGSFGSQPTCATVSWAPPTSSVRLKILPSSGLAAPSACGKSSA